jgi:hypothetical protein
MPDRPPAWLNRWRGSVLRYPWQKECPVLPVGREKRIPGDLMEQATSLFEDLPLIAFSNI